MMTRISLALLELFAVSCNGLLFPQIAVRPRGTHFQKDTHGLGPGGGGRLINSKEGRSNLLVHHGIPKLFRWLVDLYPIVLESVGEGLSGGDAMAVDNFYLDMNGIIHTCTHSNNDKLVALNEKEMFQRIFAYTDRLYKLVKPSRLMFLAIDGVAPRAKMNQQRSRRFRSSKEREALLAEFVAKEGKLPDEESFDSNCITPGTDFMFRLGIAFRRWIAYKMETDEFWRTGAEVVFSGPDVPGEGEHKVMDMIRADKAKDPNYTPGKHRHCMYGLDADLIMLSLVTHEPFFVLLREKISTRRKGNKDALSYSPEDFELLEISLLRQMLKQHFRRMGEEMNARAARAEATALGLSSSSSAPAESKEGEGAQAGEASASPAKEEQAGAPRFDLERVIDDFVFMCFFVGNDFLPCIPHLDIADGSLNLMMNVYRDLMPTLGGYLTDKSSMHLPRIELFLQEIARREPLYFQQRATDEKEPLFADDGYKTHYYKSKFGMSPLPGSPSTDVDPAARRKLVGSYLEGLAWVLQYYHNGCGSWTWYYPYLYGPLATDLRGLAELPLHFEEGAPFTPLLQLLSVLPPQSSNFLPAPYSLLMTRPESPLFDFYPKDFSVDANGKKNSWECVVQIPFISEKVLLDTISTIDHKKELTESERQRNILGEEHRFPPPSPQKPDPSRKSVGGYGYDRNRDNAGWGNALVDSARSSSPRPGGGGGGGKRYNSSKR